jgi:hypothetical protein
VISKPYKNGVWKILCRSTTIDILFLTKIHVQMKYFVCILCTVVVLCLPVTNSTVFTARPSTNYDYLHISPILDLKVTSFLTKVKVGIRFEGGSGT